MVGYHVEVKRKSRRPFQGVWDSVRNGYAPIIPTGMDVLGVFGKRRKTTIMDSLEVVNTPYATLSDSVPATSVANIKHCTKLHFLVSLLEDIRKAKTPITLAIVGSCIERESLFIEALTTYRFKFESIFSPLYGVGKTRAPLYGVRVQFASKNRLEKPNDVLTVDYVIVYDSALVTNRDDILNNFKGVDYERPGILSLVTLYTPDARLCNYRDAHPKALTNPNVLIKSISSTEQQFFTDIRYKRENINERINRNENMVRRVRKWMFTNDNSIFKPLHNSYQNYKTMQNRSTNNDTIDAKIEDTQDCKISCIIVKPESVVQKRMQPNAGNDSPKKRKTGGSSLDDVIMLDDSSDDDESNVPTKGDPVVVLLSDSSNESNISAEEDSSDTSDDEKEHMEITQSNIAVKENNKNSIQENESIKTKVATTQITLAESLNTFQMELEQLHAEFVRKISQN